MKKRGGGSIKSRINGSKRICKIMLEIYELGIYDDH